MASEEDEELIHVESKEGNYVAVFDPLDGSSNIDVNISIGSWISRASLIEGQARSLASTSAARQQAVPRPWRMFFSLEPLSSLLDT
jgi:fructose-1,6-bisphosphatase